MPLKSIAAAMAVLVMALVVLPAVSWRQMLRLTCQSSVCKNVFSQIFMFNYLVCIPSTKIFIRLWHIVIHLSTVTTHTPSLICP